MSALNCVFCDIVAGIAPASFVYRTDRVVAFLDIRPVTPGHLLVVPRTHVESLAEASPETIGELFAAARHLAGALRRSGIRADGIHLSLADGEAAGQEVWHVHVHVVPRFADDGFGVTAEAWHGRPPERHELDALASQVRAHVHD